MQDAETMGLRDRVAGVNHVLDCLLHGHRSAHAQHLVEIPPVEIVRHHERQSRLEPTDVDHPRSVLAPDLRDGPRSPEESRHGLAATSGSGQQISEPDALPELDV